MKKAILKALCGFWSGAIDKNIIGLGQVIFALSASISWLAMVLTICYVVISGREDAVNIINAFSETASLWGAVLGVLGVSMLKTSPKKTKVRKTQKKVLS